MKLRPLTNDITVCMLLLLASLLAGCGTTKIDPAQPQPQRLDITLRSASTDQRYTYFVLINNELSFGGGKQATLRQAEPVLTLSPAQRRELWDIIVREKLLEAPSAGRLAKGSTVTYELEIRCDYGHRSIRALDQTVPGVKLLHDSLFKMQADKRYGGP